MITVGYTSDVVTSPAVQRAVNGRHLVLGGVFVTAVVLLVNAIWYSMDQRVPSTDEAGHILNGLQYQDLLHHIRPFKLSWWHSFLSVNPFYPPGVYVYDGLLKLFIKDRVADNLCFLTYVGVLTASTYGIAVRLGARISTAICATLLLNFYPQIAKLSHVYMLDLPLAAMVTAGMWALLWWQANPTWKRTFGAAAIVAAACLTKQIGAGYLLLPCIYLLWTSRSSRVQLAQLGSLGALVAVPFATWFFVNIDFIRSYAKETLAQMGSTAPSPLVVFGDYFVGLAYSMTFPLTIALLAGLVMMRKDAHRALLPLYLSSVGGIFLMSFTPTFPLDRYAAPALVTCAIATMVGLRNKYMVALTLLVGLVTYVTFSFTGNPMGPGLREFRGATIVRSTPSNTVAWQQEWVVETIAARDGALPVWLNVLPSHGYYNPHSFELLAKEKNLLLKPTSSRRWTIVGDEVDFSPESALYYHWYLVKTGDQGNKFKDAQSEINYGKLIDFVENSGKFVKIAQRPLPDKSELTLYRQR
jgi:hypothetical protein